MSGRDKDKIGWLFAQLTGQLEDASGLAVEGQNRKLSLVTRTSLVMRLRRRLSRASRTADSIGVAISEARGGQP